MHFDIGCIGEIPDDKLKELSATLATRVRDAKKKVGQHLKHDQPLMTAWITKLGVDPPKALPEEVMEVRNRRKREFEMALLANPEAFVAFQVSNFMVSLLEEIRAERIRRVPTKING
jgi:hypothetical protein